MSLDDKLKNWRDATEPLEPSDQLMEKLRSAVETPTPPGAAAVAVKVIIVTLLIGVAGTALLAQRLGWSWSTPPKPQPPPRIAAKVVEVIDAGCGPMPEYSGALTAMPWSPPPRELRGQLAARPLTCVAQRRPLQDLTSWSSGNDAEMTKWSARLAYLCGPSAIPFLAQPRVDKPCDTSDWCRRPSCDVSVEACALQWVKAPASTCTHRDGVRSALNFACTRLLRGQQPEASVRDLEKEAWCLKPEALKERDDLQRHDAGMELP